MTWIESVPIGLACVAWLFIPGVAVTYAVGMRDIALWAAAPIASVSILATLAVLAAMVGVSWSVPAAAIACGVVGVVANLAALLLRRWVPVVHRVDPGYQTLAALAGLVPGIVLGGLSIVRALKRPEALSQTFDAAFHYNAIAVIAADGNGSSLGMASLGNPDTAGSFYPAAFHDVAALVFASTGGSIPATANLLAAVIVLVAWPLACVLLVRQLLGAANCAMVVAGILATAFVTFPWGLLTFGVLWPNSLGMVFVPVGLAAVVSVMGLAENDILGPRRAWLLLLLTFLGAGFSHPNAVFTLITLGIVGVLAGLVRRAVRQRAAGAPWWSGVAPLVGVAAAFGGFWWWAATSPALEPVRTFFWPPFLTTPRAVGEVLLNATHSRPGLWLLSILVLVGAVACWRSGPRRWLVAAHVVSGTLYVLASARNVPSTQKYTGYWYNDSYRLAAMLTITAVPLAAAGVVLLAERLSAAVAAPAGGGFTGALRSRLPGWMTAGPAVALALTVLLMVVTGGFAFTRRTEMLAYPYAIGRQDPETILTTSQQRTFYRRIGGLIPAHAVVANNPWDGSVLLWALTGRRVLVPHLEPSLSDDQRYLAAHLVEAATDPRVCQAANRLQVEYMILGDGRFWRWEAFTRKYSGITDPGSRPGFELIDAQGSNRLYRITACATG